MSCEKVWCTMTDGAEHDEYHAGDPVELAGSDGSLLGGWWCWLTQDRPAGSVTVVVEGHQEPTVEIDATAVAALLSATSAPEARQALAGLLGAGGVEVAS